MLKVGQKILKSSMAISMGFWNVKIPPKNVGIINPPPLHPSHLRPSAMTNVQIVPLRCS